MAIGFVPYFLFFTCGEPAPRASAVSRDSPDRKSIRLVFAATMPHPSRRPGSLRAGRDGTLRAARSEILDPRPLPRGSALLGRFRGAWPRLQDRAAGDARAGVARRVGLHVVRLFMDHHRRATFMEQGIGVLSGQ